MRVVPTTRGGIIFDEGQRVGLDAMTIDELSAELKRRQALVVHFSHHASMRGDLIFPTDLLDILKGENNWCLSCSVLTPGHAMDVVGSVGVILEPQAAGQGCSTLITVPCMRG